MNKQHTPPEPGQIWNWEKGTWCFGLIGQRAVPKHPAFTIGSLVKGVYPWPVYEATFADGSTVRMSFWTKPKTDFERGRRLCESFARAEAVSGVVHGAGEPQTDPHFLPQEAQKTKAKRPTVKETREALAAVLAFVRDPSRGSWHTVETAEALLQRAA